VRINPAVHLAALAAAVLSLAAGSAFAQPTQHERDYALSALYASEKQFLDSLNGLSQGQLNFKPAPDRWSVFECAEHIAVAEDTLFAYIPMIMKTPYVEKKLPVPEADDEKILVALTDRSHKANAPEVLKPTHRFASIEELKKHFVESRTRTLDYIRYTQDDLRHHQTQTPMGDIDGYQFVLLIAGHSERHTLQIKEVMADPNFPK
jgi:DinB superfamily